MIVQDVARLKRADGVVPAMASSITTLDEPAPISVMLFVEGLRVRVMDLSGPATLLVPDGPVAEERTWTVVYQRRRTSRC